MLSDNADSADEEDGEDVPLYSLSENSDKKKPKHVQRDDADSECVKHMKH